VQLPCALQLCDQMNAVVAFTLQLVIPSLLSLLKVMCTARNPGRQVVTINLFGLWNSTYSVHSDHMVSMTAGPQNLSAAVLSPTSVYLTWVAPCDTQQYHIYYRGTCGTYVDEGSVDTNHTEYTFDELQEGNLLVV